MKKFYVPANNYSTFTKIELREECAKLEWLRDESINTYAFVHYQALLDEVATVATKKKIKL